MFVEIIMYTTMENINKVIFLCVLIINVVTAAAATHQQKFFKFNSIRRQKSAHISPEIINELKAFKDLIPSATVDEIVAKHYVVDGSFRTALKYLRSDEFTLLQRQLLNVPEIIEVVEFLHLTTANATKRHLGATKMPAAAIRGVKALLHEYLAEAGSANDKMTTNTDTPTKIVKEALSNLRVPERPPLQQQEQKLHMHEDNNNNTNKYVGIKDNNVDDEAANANSIDSSEQESLVHYVLWGDFIVDEKGYRRQHHHRHNRQHYYHYQLHSSLGTFTTFVEEVLQYLPNAAYQNMIKDKCSKNPKFAEFYQALRRTDLKILIDHIKTTSNIRKIIETFNSHDVDIEALEPIAFKVISWGPNV